MRAHPPAWARGLLAALVPLGVLAWGLRGPLGALDQGIWGPEDPWANGDWVGAWWLWWALERQRRGLPGFALLEHPDGWDGLRGVFPNPWDLWLLSHTGPPTALGWNLVQLAHLVLLVLGCGVLARRLGASAWGAAAGASLVAASPVLLHEVAGGRPATLVAWPAAFCLAALVSAGRWRWVGTGVWAAVQGVAYAWQGVTLALAALPLVRSWRQAAAAAALGAALVLPYVVWVAQGDVPTDRPPAGYTALPLAGLVGLGEVPPRFRLHPLLLGAALLGLRANPRLGAAAAVALVVALGPSWSFALGDPLVSGPWAWLAWAVPAARRLHHPVRAALVLLPLLGALVALGLDRVRGGRWLAHGLVVAALANHQAMREATAWARPERPPFADHTLPGQGALVDVLGMPHRGALALQTLHGRPILETAWNRRPDRSPHDQVERLSRGEAPDPQLWSALRAAGFSHVLVFDRFDDPRAPAVRAHVEAALGPPVAEGVYSLGP